MNVSDTLHSIFFTLLHTIACVFILFLSEILGFILSAALAEVIPSIPLKIFSNTFFYILTAYFCFAWYTRKVLKLPLSTFRTKKQMPSVWWFTYFLFIFFSYFIVILVVSNGNGKWHTAPLLCTNFTNQILTVFIDKGFGAGIVEELIFRGLLLVCLEKHIKRSFAIFVSSLAFTILHIPVFNTDYLYFSIEFIYIFIIGILFAIMFFKSNTLWPSMVFHGLYNIVFNLVYIGKISDNIKFIWAYEVPESKAMLIITITALINLLFTIFLMRNNFFNVHKTSQYT